MARTQRKRKWLRLLWLPIAVLLFSLLWFASDFTYVSTGNVTDYAVSSDVIIIFGCPSYENNVVSSTFSACVQARAHHAADLYRRGLAPNILPTGGLTGPPPSEAAAMTSVLKADGIPATAITLEEQAHDTVQNIQFSRAIMQAHGWRTAILVSEPNHIKRAAFIATDAGLDFTISPATDSPGWNTPDARLQNLLRDTRTLMTYQLNRLTSGPP